MMIVSDRSIEQLKAARIALERANAEYAAWIAQTGSSHGSDTAAAVRRELKLELLLLELNRHLAEIERRCTSTERQEAVMMIRSFADLHPLLRRQYARNKERIEGGTAPPIADMFADTDIVFAVWPSDAGILHYIMIKGRGVLREAFDAGALISGKVNTLPVSDRDGAPGARRTDAEEQWRPGLHTMPIDWDVRIAAAIAAEHKFMIRSSARRSASMATR